MILDRKKQILKDDFTHEIAEYSQEVWGGGNFYDMLDCKFHIMKKNLPKIPGYQADKLNIPHICDKHGMVMVHNNRWQSCPLCADEKQNLKCEICGNVEHVHFRVQTDVYVCQSCKEKLSGYNPKCRAQALKKCEKHGYWLRSAPKEKCVKCRKEANQFPKYAQCLDLIANDNQTAWKMQNGEILIIYQKCKHCGKWFRVQYESQNCQYFSLKCETQHLSGPMECPMHGHQELSMNGQCVKCMQDLPASKEHRKQHFQHLAQVVNQFQMQYCDKCDQATLHDGYGNCDVCRSKDSMQKLHHMEPAFCEKCGKVTNHDGYGNCLSCKMVIANANRDPSTYYWCTQEFRDQLKQMLEDLKQNFKNQNILDHVQLHDLDLNLTVVQENYQNYLGVPGVWCKMDAQTGEILDVMSTSNLGSEFCKIQQWMQDPPNRKYELLQDHDVILVMYELFLPDDPLKRSLVEMALALKHDAKYWSPDPFQMQLMKQESQLY